MAYCGADHLFGATSPAFVKPRVADQDREVIAAPVMAGAGAGRTPCHIVPPDLAYLTHVSQDVELRSALLSAILPDAGRAGRRLQGISVPAQFNLRYPPQSLEIRHLRIQRMVRPVEPKPAVHLAMNAQRPTNGIAKPACAERIVLRENFNSIPQAALLHRYTQSQGEVVDVNPAFLRQQRRSKKDPEVPPALTPF